MRQMPGPEVAVKAAGAVPHRADHQPIAASSSSAWEGEVLARVTVDGMRSANILNAYINEVGRRDRVPRRHGGPENTHPSARGRCCHRS